MRGIVVLAMLWLGLLAGPVQAQSWEDTRSFGAEDARLRLSILSSTDTSFFAPVIDRFLSTRPDIAVDYFVTGTSDLDKIFRADPATYDLVISSAMDLQLKLANDGFARRLDGITHPGWAAWRDSLFAFTSEPAAIVVNRAAFEGHPLPRTRQDLIAAMRARADVFDGRLGTYDVRRSGVGYLFATQDARASETFWRLMEVMGSLRTRLYCCSGEMIDDLISGEILVAYNVLGSYAAAREDARAALEIILPSDFPTTMMRTGFVARDSKHPEAASAFLRHLIAQTDHASSSLPPLGRAGDDAEQATIALEPALLTYLDRLKRRTFLEEWESAVIQSP